MEVLKFLVTFSCLFWWFNVCYSRCYSDEGRVLVCRGVVSGLKALITPKIIRFDLRNSDVTIDQVETMLNSTRGTIVDIRSTPLCIEHHMRVLQSCQTTQGVSRITSETTKKERRKMSTPSPWPTSTESETENITISTTPQIAQSTQNSTTSNDNPDDDLVIRYTAFELWVIYSILSGLFVVIISLMTAWCCRCCHFSKPRPRGCPENNNNLTILPKHSIPTPPDVENISAESVEIWTRPQYAVSGVRPRSPHSLLRKDQ